MKSRPVVTTDWWSAITMGKGYTIPINQTTIPLHNMGYINTYHSATPTTPQRQVLLQTLTEPNIE